MKCANGLTAGDMLVLFAEGTSGDGTRVLPFKSTFFAAAENSDVAVQPLSVVYTGHRNLPMPRRLRPLYAWYGDMEMPPHLWAAMAPGAHRGEDHLPSSRSPWPITATGKPWPNRRKRRCGRGWWIRFTAGTKCASTRP